VPVAAPHLLAKHGTTPAPAFAAAAALALLGWAARRAKARALLAKMVTRAWPTASQFLVASGPAGRLNDTFQVTSRLRDQLLLRWAH
jgi:hypothetical protein